MNIYEALKSGKRYRRPPGKKYDPNFWYPALCPSYVADRTVRTMFTFEDMIADDWEVEEKQITITETDFANAVWETRKKHCSVPGEHPADITRWVCLLKQELFKELGP